MPFRSCAVIVVLLLLTAARPLDAGEYILRFERLTARGWREKPEQGQVLLRYERTVQPEVPFRGGLVAGRDRLELSGLVTPHADGRVELSFSSHISIAPGEIAPNGGVASPTVEGWSNHFELTLNLEEPATVSPTRGNEWKLNAGKQINSTSVARERIRLRLIESPRPTDQGVQLAAGQSRDPTADDEHYTVRISQMSAAANPTGKARPPESEQIALFFDARPGVSTIVRCAFGTTECVANTLLLPSQTGRLRTDMAVAFMEHDKSYSPEKLDQPHDVLRQLSARTSVHTRLGERTSLGESSGSPSLTGSAGLCIRIDAPLRK